MRPTLVFAALLFAVSTPALAQEAGAPGATGVGGSLTGSNPGTSYGPNDDYGPGPYGYDRGPDPYGEYGPEAGPYYGPDMEEGRAAAPEAPLGDRADPTPETVRGDKDRQNW